MECCLRPMLHAICEAAIQVTLANRLPTFQLLKRQRSRTHTTCCAAASHQATSSIDRVGPGGVTALLATALRLGRFAVAWVPPAGDSPEKYAPTLAMAAVPKKHKPRLAKGFQPYSCVKNTRAVGGRSSQPRLVVAAVARARPVIQSSSLDDTGC